MPFEWSLNPYLGCAHSCVYCYAREYHAKRGRDIGAGFDREVDVKLNFAEVLRAELSSGRRSGSIALGTGTDPYQPAEGRYGLTRGSLAALVDHPLPLSIVTKSPLIVRDTDLLAELTRRTGGALSVYFSVGTVDPDVARSTEPDAAPPLKRLEAVRRLRQAGVAAGVLCAPILPGLSDSEGSIEAVALAAASHGAAFFHSRLLKLDPHVKQYYFAFLLAQFPALLESERERYRRGAYADASYADEIDGRVERVRRRYRFIERLEPREPRREQLRLAV